MFNVKKIIKKISVCCVMAALVTGMPAGCGKKNENSKKTEIIIFAAKSLNGVMDELCKEYNKEHPDINFHTNYDRGCKVQYILFGRCRADGRA